MLISLHEESRACCAEAIEITRSVGARAEAGHALNTLGCDLAYLGQPDDAVAYLREALAIAEEVQDLDDLCRAYLNLSDLFSGPLNRLEEGLALAFAGAELAERKGMAADHGVSLQTNAAAAFLRLGCLRDAEAILLAAERRNPRRRASRSPRDRRGGRRGRTRSRDRTARRTSSNRACMEGSRPRQHRARRRRRHG
jgi:tetratricopeptide (TPR) repeat protein